MEVGPADISILRTAAISDVEQIIEDKSRQLKPFGDLPALVDLLVRLQAGQQQLSYQPGGRVEIPEKQFVTQPFEEAFLSARKTLLLGDLGSGKSTLVATFAKTYMTNEEHSLVLMVPCKLLHLTNRFRISELIDSLDAYFAEQIAPKGEQLDLKTLLSNGIDVTLVFDGLDELARSFAPYFVKQIARLVSNWPSIRLVATGRPVELIGVSYSSWNVCEICPLSDEQKLEILEHEFSAESADKQQASADAKQCVQNLKHYPLMNAVAVTPLALRLISSRLKDIGSEYAPTLGDLLFELADERLSNWEKREGRESHYDNFTAKFPMALDRIELLGKLALELHLNETSLAKDACAQFLSEQIDSNISRVVADEAIQFYCETGLLVIDKFVEFRFEPLMQICAGTELLSSWINREERYELGDVSWRIVSFSASVARRRGQLEQARSKLTYYLKQLLCANIGVAAACYIVNESRDESLAKTALKLFGGLGRRPLWWNSNEEQASSRAIASTIALASEQGFDWLFGSYLDPRVPLINRGSAIISSVFANWIPLVKDNLTESQLNEISKLAVPYRAFDGVLFFLEKLVFLCPEEFTVDEQIWLYAKQIGANSALGRFAKEKIIEHFNGSDKRIVNSTLIEQAESSIEAAFLYLQLNDEEIPRKIVLAIVRNCSSSNIQDRVNLSVNRIKEYFEIEKWKAILRFCLTSNDQERRMNANAARLLYEAGERDFELLVEPLMEGMHDGLRAYKCKEYLAELVAEDPQTRARIVADKIIEFNDITGGAHAGWWHILFDNLEAFADEAPSILADCTKSIGPYLLARNPDIRMAFHGLMKLPEYHEEFSRRLWDVCPTTRFGIAMVLSTFDPSRECEAVFSVIKGRPFTRQVGYFEWEEFFLSLDFGFTVQEYVHEHLGTLPKQSKALALALLAKNEFELTTVQIEEFRELQLEFETSVPRSLGIGKTHPSTEEALEQLKSLLQNPLGEKSQNASELLLQYHQDKLTDEEIITCWIILSANGKLAPDALCIQLTRLAEDGTWREKFNSTGGKITSDASFSSVLLDAAIAIDNAEKWRDVVWTIFCDDNRHGIDLDEECSGFFEFVLLKPEFRDAIGEAAKSFLNDPRIDKGHFTDKYHWLALVAGTFASLDEGEIEAALCCSAPIFGTAARGLVALLNRIPRNLPERNRSSEFPAFPLNEPSFSSPDEIRLDIERICLPSEQLSAETERLVEDSVFVLDPSEEWLSEIAQKGLHGKLIAQCLRYCFGREQSLTDRAAIVEGGWVTPSQQNDQVRTGLFKLQSRAFLSQMSKNPDSRSKYLDELDRRLSANKTWNHSIIYEILATSGRLETHQIEQVFCEYATHQGTLHLRVGELLVGWLAGELSGKERDVVIMGAKKAISILNELPWDKPGWGYGSAPFPYLIFPLVVWRFLHNAYPEGDLVFLRGIRYLFSPEKHQPNVNLKTSFEVVEPLLSHVPHELIQRALDKGKEFPDPAIRSFIHLIHSLGKN